MPPDLAAVLAQVRQIDPVDEREERSVLRILAEAPLLADPFDEEADAVHLTASGFVVGERGTILHRHRKLGIWVQPGGHIDPGEPPVAAAVRETREETGLEVCSAAPEGLLFHVDVHPGPRGHTHFDLRYVLLATSEDPAPPPGESQEVVWCAFDEVAGLAEPALVPALHRLGAAWLDETVGWREKVEQMQDRRPGTPT